METPNIHLPPGFRFHPSDEELIIFYLRNKATSRPIPASIVAEVDLYKYNPWELPKKALFGEEEWYFFSPRDRKYPNGARPNRAAASGYWKATGTDKPILTAKGSQSIGVKKALVFYKGRPPKGLKTNWIMHEYRLLDNMIKPTSKSRSSMRLDDWVLCRVRQKDVVSRNTWEDHRSVIVSQPLGYYPKVESVVNPSMDIIANYRNNGCPMLAYVLSSHQDVPPCNETTSILSFQEQVLDMGSSLVTDSSIASLKRSPKKDVNAKYTTLLPSSKRAEDRSTDNLCFSDEYLPRDNIFSPELEELGGPSLW